MNLTSLIKESKDKLFVEGDYLWFSHSPGSGNTYVLRDLKKPLSNHPEVSNGEYELDLFKAWMQNNKPIRVLGGKALKNQHKNLTMLYKIPVYAAAHMYGGYNAISRFDIFAKDKLSSNIIPEKFLYIVYVSEKYDWLHFFKSKQEALSWM